MSKLPPLVCLLLHLDACPDAVAWAGSRPINATALADCPRPEWRNWLASALSVGVGDPATRWISAAKTALSGSGSGSGYGDGYGYGDFSLKASSSAGSA